MIDDWVFIIFLRKAPLIQIMKKFEMQKNSRDDQSGGPIGIPISKPKHQNSSSTELRLWRLLLQQFQHQPLRTGAFNPIEAWVIWCKDQLRKSRRMSV